MYIVDFTQNSFTIFGMICDWLRACGSHFLGELTGSEWTSMSKTRRLLHISLLGCRSLVNYVCKVSVVVLSTSSLCPCLKQ